MESSSRRKRFCLEGGKSDFAGAKNSTGSYSSKCIQKFIAVMSGLSPKQRSVVNDIGFSSLLSLSCSEVPYDLYKWLVLNFDTDSKTLKLPNGFTFQLNEKCVDKVLGIPEGSRYIKCRGTLQSLQVIQELIPSQGPTPSIDELCSFITPDLNGPQFAIAFMLLALSAFLCPSTRSVSSCRYYSAIINVHMIRESKWRSLVLDWLLFYIKKYKATHNPASDGPIGGCAFLLVVCYLEFLSTSEYNFGTACPRISVWSSTLVQSFTYLDKSPGLNTSFGRLHLKHICSTPFKECFDSQCSTALLSECLGSYVKQYVSDVSQDNVMQLVSELSQSIQQSVNPSCLPAVSAAVEKLFEHLCYELSASKYSSITYLEDSDSDSDDIDHKVPVKVQKKYHFNDEAIDHFCKYFFTLPVPKIESQDNVEELISSVVQSIMSQSYEVEDGFNLESSSFEESLFNDLPTKCIIQSDQPEIDMLSLAGDCYSRSKDMVAENVAPERREDTRFLDALLLSLQSAESDSHDCSSNVQDRSICPLDRNLTDSHQLSEFFPEQTDNNDRFVTREVNCTLVKELRAAFRKCSELISQEKNASQPESSIPKQLNSDAKEFTTVSEEVPLEVYASPLEKELFLLLTSNIDRRNQGFRIFQNEHTWVDQFKLSLSMMNRGWLHFHVMDCFCKLFTWNQGMFPMHQSIYQHFFDSKIVSILMNPSLDHSMYKKDFLLTIGLKLDKGGLLHIPCNIDRQWVLLTVNFKDREFDIMNSESRADETNAVIHTVISNFKVFFCNAYPDCSAYNIDAFPVRYINVPKHTFRYDSGVFVLFFIQTFNGSSVVQFSNSDVANLRAKLTFQLLTSNCNQAQCPLLTKFLLEHNLK